jgi:hypothetical protein
MAIDEKYQSDHLMLLVGSNPLPNAVAGRLLTKPEGEIALFHTPDSANVAKNLKVWLESKGNKVGSQIEIRDEADPVDITSKVKGYLKDKMPLNPGLHYTGGTKAMAVHAWQAVEKWGKENKRINTTTRSYLNSRSLEMIIDPVDPDSGESAKRINVGLAVELTIKDLMQLHGLELTESSSVPVLPATAKAMVEVYAEPASLERWKRWINSELEVKCRPKGNWKKEPQLSKESIQPFPDESVTRAFMEEGGSVNETLPLDQSQITKGVKFYKWLHGKWLEQHVLASMHAIATEVQVHDYTANIKTKPTDFEVDIVAIRGYQMFAISCTTSKNKGLVKSKLFEAYVRARQMGGDEARIALVCCSDDPAKVQSEMQQTLGDNGRIRVFGQSDLPDIGNKLKQWILDQSKGAR